MTETLMGVITGNRGWRWRVHRLQGELLTPTSPNGAQTERVPLCLPFNERLPDRITPPQATWIERYWNEQLLLAAFGQAPNRFPDANTIVSGLPSCEAPANMKCVACYHAQITSDAETSGCRAASSRHSVNSAVGHTIDAKVARLGRGPRVARVPEASSCQRRQA